MEKEMDIVQRLKHSINTHPLLNGKIEGEGGGMCTYKTVYSIEMLFKSAILRLAC